jgi:glucose/arabinose dehydrogenase
MKPMKTTISLCLTGLILLTGASDAATILNGKSAGMAYRLEEVAGGLGTVWGMAFLSPAVLLISEKEGRVKRLDLGSGRLSGIGGVPPVWNRGQGGLLDVAVPPDFAEDGWIYFTHAREQGGRGITVLARARLRGDVLADWAELLATRSASTADVHFGSRIAFDDRGHLFFSVGDRGNRENGQDAFSHAGKILRLNRDGSVPHDNPLVGGSGLPEIWSYGHRNPQGLFWDAGRRILWASEHGPRGGDEINLIEPGQNYGWPVVSHGKEYWGPVAVGEATSKAGMVDPVKVYIPSIAPGSLLVYSGAAFPNWRGNLFSGALALTHLNRVMLDDRLRAVGEERLLEDLDERIRALVESPEGYLFLSTDSGRILVLKPDK